MEFNCPSERIFIASSLHNIHDFRHQARLASRVGGITIGDDLPSNFHPRSVANMARSCNVKSVYMDLRYQRNSLQMPGIIKNIIDCKPNFISVSVTSGMEAMAAAVANVAAYKNDHKNSKVIAYIIDHYKSEDSCRETFNRSIKDYVTSMAELAAEAGVDGVMTSATESELVASHSDPKVSSLIRFATGIRIPGKPALTQARQTLEPTSALDSGADILVIGQAFRNDEAEANLAATLSQIS